MNGSRAAIRYAKSLLSLAQERSCADAVNNDCVFMAKTINDNKDLRLVLKSPIIKTDVKLSALNKIFGASINELSTQFLSLLANQSRTNILLMITEAYTELYKESRGIASAEIITAQALSEDIKTKISQLLAKSQGKTIELSETVDTSLIGGYIVKVGDKQIDLSLSRKISDLKQRLYTRPQTVEQ
jgi:F-type H+-transporting ATPase subunit delta